MTKKEIRKTIREIKREMKELGLRRISFMNGGLTSEEQRYNERLFKLSCDLEKAL
jgi:hypothetical protein